MDNYIFLTNYYLPKPGATGMCVHQVAKALATNSNVFTVCYEDNELINEKDGVKIRRVKVPYCLKRREKENRWDGLGRRCQSMFLKLIHLYNYPLRSRKLVRGYYASLCEILDKCGEATVIASYTPLEAVIAASKIKKIYKTRIKLVYYSTDTLSNEQGKSGILSESYRNKCGVRWERKLFSVYDKILIMECHESHYFSSTYRDMCSKMELVNFPLFTQLFDYSKKKLDSNKLTLVYAGTFYRTLRNPQFLCDCLIQLGQLKNISVDFLGGGDCNDIIERAVMRSKGVIKFHGMQSHEIVMDYLIKADVLLSVGNAESPMAPSKIYEYMSTGKPIIHIYTYDKDPCIVPLNNYGNALLIREGDEEGIIKIKNFINNYKVLDYKEVEKKFITSTPQYTAHILQKLSIKQDPLEPVV